MKLVKCLLIIKLLTVLGINSYAQAPPPTTIRLYCGPFKITAEPLWIIVLKKKSYVLKNEFTSAVNKNTIEKIEVLKDAAATAIYGKRAAYGVIVLTIKKKESRKEYKRLKRYLEKV